MRVYQWIPGKSTTPVTDVGSYLEWVLHTRGHRMYRLPLFQAGRPEVGPLPAGVEVFEADGVERVRFTPQPPIAIEDCHG